MVLLPSPKRRWKGRGKIVRQARILSLSYGGACTVGRTTWDRQQYRAASRHSPVWTWSSVAAEPQRPVRNQGVIGNPRKDKVNCFRASAFAHPLSVAQKIYIPEALQFS